MLSPWRRHLFKSPLRQHWAYVYAHLYFYEKVCVVLNRCMQCFLWFLTILKFIRNYYQNNKNPCFLAASVKCISVSMVPGPQYELRWEQHSLANKKKSCSHSSIVCLCFLLICWNEPSALCQNQYWINQSLSAGIYQDKPHRALLVVEIFWI